MKRKTLLTLLVAAPMSVFALCDAANSSLIHRWSFNGGVEDSIGNSDAKIVGNVTTDGKQYKLPGGTSGSAYIDLGDNLVPTTSKAVTLEFWATREPGSGRWDRVYDFGSMPDGYSFSRCDTSCYSTDNIRLFWNGETDFNLGVQPTVGTQYHIAAVFEETTGGKWQAHYYVQPSAGGAVTKTTRDMEAGWSFSKVGQTEWLLGQPLTCWDVCAKASYDEVRIWEYALSEEEFSENTLTGTDAIIPQKSEEPPTGTDVPEGGPYKEEVGGIEWTFMVDANLNAILGANGTAIPRATEGAIVIPSTLGGRAVVSIGAWSFSGCSGLTSVSIPLGVTYIGFRAFESCSGLTSLKVPSSVTVVAPAFTGCSKLNSIEVEPTNVNYTSQDGVLFDKVMCTIVACPGGKRGEYAIPSSVTTISESAFSGCSGLTSLTIPSSVTRIGEWAFHSCSGLTSLTIPSSATSIGECAFYGCSGLITLTIPPTVTSIGHQMFRECRSLMNISMPSSVTSIGDAAFEDCDSLAHVTIPSSAKSIGDCAFIYCDDLEDVTIQSGVTSIGSFAFSGCGKLTSLTIPSSVTSIGEWAFLESENLLAMDFEGAPPSGLPSASIRTDATIRYNVVYEAEWLPVIEACGWTNARPYMLENDPLPNGGPYKEVVNDVMWTFIVTNGASYVGNGCEPAVYPWTKGKVDIPSSLGNRIVVRVNDKAFAGCYDITDVGLPMTITEIGSEAFSMCANLKSVTIPSSVRYIETGAFRECSNLVALEMSNGLSEIGASAFEQCVNLGCATIPRSVKTIGDSAFFMCQGLTNVTVVSDCVVIGHSVFAYCGKLSEVSLSEGTMSIGDGAFHDCAISSVLIPAATTNIGVNAFSGCRSLLTIDIAMGNSVYSSEDGVLFSKDKSHLIRFPAGRKGHYEVPSCVSVIDTEAFSESGLKELTIPDVVSVISERAFLGAWDLCEISLPTALGDIPKGLFSSCTSLKQLTIPSSVTNVGSKAFVSCSSLKRLELPNGVLCIDDRTFSGCTKLELLTVPASVVRIGANAFDGCASLSNIVFLGDAPHTSVGTDYSFSGMVKDRTAIVHPEAKGWDDDGNGEWSGFKLEHPKSDGGPYIEVVDGIEWSYVVKNGQVMIGANDETRAVPISTAGRLVIPSTLGFCAVADIGVSAFSGCSLLTDVIIPEGVTNIDNYAFRYCSGVRSVSMPRTVKCIGNGAFCGCSGLESVEIPLGVEIVADEAFEDCSGLKAISIPNGVTKLGWRAFYRCTNLDDIVIPEGVSSIGGFAFYGCSSVTNVTVPASVTSVGDSAFNQCRALSGVCVTNLNAWCGIEFDGAWANPLYHAKRMYLNGELVTHLTIPNGLARIGSYAFYNCSNIEDVSIPACTTNIGRDAFGGCDAVRRATLPGWKCTLPFDVVTNLVISQGTTFIPDYSFQQCDRLSCVTIPESVTNIGKWAFAECVGLANVSIPRGVMQISSGAFSGCEGVRSVKLATGLATIGAYVFNGCRNIEAITIPASVTSVGSSAFGSCKRLMAVDFEGVPPMGLANASFAQDAAIRYNVAYEAEWLSVIQQCGWTNATSYQPLPSVPGEPGAVVTYDPEKGYCIKPSEENLDVEVTIPAGVEPEKVTVVLGTDVETVKPNGANVKIVKSGNDITSYLDIPTADASGMVDLTKAAVKSEIVKEALDPDKGAKIVLNAESPSLTTSETKPGLTYTLHEGATLKGMNPGDSKVGDRQPWTPSITIKGGTSGFYTISVEK